MKAENHNKYVYIVISQTGTILSRILKAFTHREYNHASISLKDDLSVMYSFGRKYPYNPFLGRFVIESPNFGTFKRFANTKILLLKVYMGDEEYQCLSSLLGSMLLKTQGIINTTIWGFTVPQLIFAINLPTAITVRSLLRNCWYAPM